MYLFLIFRCYIYFVDDIPEEILVIRKRHNLFRRALESLSTLESILGANKEVDDYFEPRDNCIEELDNIISGYRKRGKT